MLGIGVILIAFVVAILGLLHSHAAKPGKAAIWGLTRLGLTLVVVSLIGLLVGIAKEIGTVRSGTAAKRWQEQTTDQLRQLDAKLRGLQASATDPAVATELGRLADRIKATASSSRESDFSMSDFSYSNFRDGDFYRANFAGAAFGQANLQGAIFSEANLQGADMSTALIDANTKLPTKR